MVYHLDVQQITLGISSCLLGEPVRYNGGHKLDRYLRDTLGHYVRYVPVCPEVECGLPVPREAMHLRGEPNAPRLQEKRSGIDHTLRITRWYKHKLNDLNRLRLSGFVLKARSPSCGTRGIKHYSVGGQVYRGSGIFASALLCRFPLIPVEDEGRLHDLALRENFIERVFAYHRWQELLQEGFTVGRLVAFHTRHKLMLMAHSPTHYTELGRIVANAKRCKKEALKEAYLAGLMEGMARKATLKKNTNVLQHIMGYFKDHLGPDEKQELLDIIAQYHRGLVPLIVPVTLLGHYVRKFREPYLSTQYYLDPHPAELMLRNHV